MTAEKNATMSATMTPVPIFPNFPLLSARNPVDSVCGATNLPHNAGVVGSSPTPAIVAQRLSSTPGVVRDHERDHDGRFSRSYEPPVVPIGTPFVVGEELQLAHGVRGYAFDEGARIAIPIIVAAHEGNGDVGRFLDSLSPRCVIVGVLSKRLAGMLVRRGFMPRLEIDGDGETVDVWARA